MRESEIFFGGREEKEKKSLIKYLEREKLFLFPSKRCCCCCYAGFLFFFLFFYSIRSWGERMRYYEIHQVCVRALVWTIKSNKSRACLKEETWMVSSLENIVYIKTFKVHCVERSSSHVKTLPNCSLLVSLNFQHFVIIQWIGFFVVSCREGQGKEEKEASWQHKRGDLSREKTKKKHRSRHRAAHVLAKVTFDKQKDARSARATIFFTLSIVIFFLFLCLCPTIVKYHRYDLRHFICNVFWLSEFCIILFQLIH